METSTTRITANRLPEDDRDATGCWAKVDDIFARSRTVFEYDVLRHATTFDEALDRVGKIRNDLLNSSQAVGVPDRISSG